MHRFSTKSIVISFVLGAVIGPLVKPAIKPYMRDVAKAAIGMGLQAKKLAAEALEDFEDIAAEASAEAAVPNKRPVA